MLKTVIKSEGKRAEKAKRKLWKQKNDEQNSSKYISANNYFKCEWTNALIKRYTVADWIKKKNSHICCQRETHFKSKDTHSLKVKKWRRFPCKWKLEESWICIFSLDKVIFKTKMIIRNKGRNFIIIKESTQ